MTRFKAPRFKDRLSGVLLTLVMLAAALSLFLFSFETMRQSPPERETILTFPRPRQEEPVSIIDARGPPRRAPLPATSAPQPPAQFTPSTPPPITTPPPAATPPPQEAAPDCSPEKWNSLTLQQRTWCQTPPSARAGPAIPASPYQPKNQAQWDAEMAKKKGTGPDELHSNPLDPMPGVGVGAIIHDPLCHAFLTLLNVKGYSCGPARPAPPVSDDKVKAALDAASKRHGIKPPANKPATSTEPAAP